MDEGIGKAGVSRLGDLREVTSSIPQVRPGICIDPLAPAQETAEGESPCCCGPSENQARPDVSALGDRVLGFVGTAAGEVPRVSTEWGWPERWGAIKSRISGFRMHYSVEPGLYAVGDPGPESDVLVSANYKLSFDLLRRELGGLSAWILVLDTKGINVWCAAGKGTFGTGELVERVRQAQLDRIVNHRRIVVPQLGAAGVSAHRVKKETGFRVRFGPVRSRDLPAYLGSGYKATPEMRSVRFTLLDRLVLTPMELIPALKKFPLYAVFVLALLGLEPRGLLWKEAWFGGGPFVLLGLTAVLAGALITPVLLPYVPFRSFAIKGWLVGLLCTALVLARVPLPNPHTTLLMAVSWFFFPAAASYVALQFTGATPYTGRSGVEKELRISVPLYLTVSAVSLILIGIYKIQEWGLL